MDARKVILLAIFTGLFIVWGLPFLIGKFAALLAPVWLIVFSKLAANSLCPSCGNQIPKMKNWFNGHIYYGVVFRGVCDNCPEDTPERQK